MFKNSIIRFVFIIFGGKMFLHMITRRHIRVKVMQAFYAVTYDGIESPKEPSKFLKSSILKTFELHLVLVALLKALHEHAQTQFEIKKKTIFTGSYY